MKEPQGKIGIVTARARGIGRATAPADAGADVVTNYTLSS
jgi:NAD(P)-dependent dehydrogenase (short-subunit alcohol dehydrogenase family)